MKPSLPLRLAVLACFVPALCDAQTGLSWGVQARAGVSSYQPLQRNDRNRIAFGAGIFADLPLNRSFSFRPQVGWLRKGYQQQFEAVSPVTGQPLGTGRFLSGYDYVPLDLTLVYRLRPHRALRPFIQVGARGSLLVNHRFIEESPISTISSSSSLDNYHRFAIGGLVSVGLQWRRFSLGAEANHDLNSFLNAPPVPLFADLKPKFRWYGFNAAYQLRGR